MLRHRFSVDHDGEVIVLVLMGQTFRLRMDEADVVRGFVGSLYDALSDAISRAGGIEPRSGDPT